MAYFQESIDLLALSYEDFINIFTKRYHKTAYHAKAFIKGLYQYGHSKAFLFEEFQAAQELGHQIAKDFPLPVITPTLVEKDENHTKFRLDFADGAFSESVIIAMKGYKTLCVSSQTGCKWSCLFCQTGKLGLLHNLTAAQILAQYFCARFYFNEEIKNIVFMGMGEALDNDVELCKALKNICDPYALDMAASNITISTVGNIDNLAKFAQLVREDLALSKQKIKGVRQPTAYRAIKIAVSLNASNNAVRSALMPVNRIWNMEVLKKTLQELPIKRKDHDLFLEYVLIPELNGTEEHADELLRYLKDLPCVINLIPYNPTPDSTFRPPTEAETNDFLYYLVEHGQVCRRRSERGQKILAACGQLGK